MKRHTERFVLDCFREVKNNYFPEWDTEGRWRISFDPEGTRGNTGYCDSSNTTIFLSHQVLTMPVPGIRALLIHEVCHDTASEDHDLGWAAEIARLAVRANELSEGDVAEILLADIYSYCNGVIFRQVVGYPYQTTR